MTENYIANLIKLAYLIAYLIAYVYLQKNLVAKAAL